jgi:uncharacterized protein (TIGR00303 family)
MMILTGIQPLFINAGLQYYPTIPCMDVYGLPGEDPRFKDAVPKAADLFHKGELIGKYLSGCSDLLILGESVPGGTTTAMCVMRAFGYDALVSSSFINNPVVIKEEICKLALARIKKDRVTGPLDIIRYTGDPMMPVAAGIAKTYSGELLLAGGTQMLAVCSILKQMDLPLPRVVTTAYVRNDTTANVRHVAEQIGAKVWYVDPGFGNLGHSGLARYCIGEVKEGMGAGGAMCLAHLMGYTPDRIRDTILAEVRAYS